MILSRLLLITSIVSFAVANLSAQELNCRVAVNFMERAQVTDKSIAQEMEKAFTQFMNETKWTSDEFKPQERIECNIQINIDNVSGTGSFDAKTQIQSARPIYGSNYNSISINFGDTQFGFTYVLSQPLVFVENSFSDNITALLSFYAYIILGMDYDSFGELAGTPLYQKAFTIVQTAQQSGGAGWQQFDNNRRSRYNLLDDLLNPQMEELRKGLYLYHRQGLDKFVSEQEEGRKSILEALKGIKMANDAKPQSNLVSTFFDSKNDEIINIFKEGDMEIRREAYNLLTNMNPSDRDKYQAIVRN
jgi:hypothetical protein